METVRAALEENAGNGREYLISDKVKKLDFTIFPELTENERINEDDGFYKTDGKISVNFALTFQYLDSKSSVSYTHLDVYKRQGPGEEDGGEADSAARYDCQCIRGEGQRTFKRI